MPIDKQKLKETLFELLETFSNVERELEKKPWFTDEWSTKSWVYPTRTKPEGVAIQLYKKSWFNKDSKGIHFECWLRNSDIQRKMAPIEFHMEAGKSKTGFNRNDFHRVFLDRSEKKILSWEIFEINKRNPARSVLGKGDFSKRPLHKVLVSYFGKLRQLEKEIDKSISELIE